MSRNNSWQLTLMHALLSADKGIRKILRAGLMKCAVLLGQIRSGILEKALGNSRSLKASIYAQPFKP
jgi:hypothetical protein